MTDDDRPGTPQDDAMQSLIGKQLRTLYDSVLVEPIPDKLVELLMKLDQVSADKSDDATHPSNDDESADQQ
ncbi:hypothetical protein DLJ53_14480 [Acuticoccus sediminis]|uniref:Anti-sigma factor NepR domain-containing protein n=1 Tax=Acuticoccus sediminis TaxID=2184697 RepID=A0A8B2NVT3_9HYPH|nr:NepR family anti-sigma factor [Acuticoccus sediminis]RAI00471.1 hypothetical protein DLJ53_14480 [Acuticoccus sediminis]